MSTYWSVLPAAGLLCSVALLPASIWAGNFFTAGAVVHHVAFGRAGLFVQSGRPIGVSIGPAGYLGYYGGYYVAPSYENLPSPSPYDFEVRPAGRLQISVQPQDAQVFVDGLRLEPAGNALFDIGLLVGSHTVQIAKLSYRSHTSSVAIETAKTTSLAIALTKEE